MSDTSSLVKNLASFVAGVVLTALVFYLMVMPKVDQTSQTNDASQKNMQAAEEKLKTTENNLKTTEAHLQLANDNIQTTEAKLQQATQQRDTCTAKFSRSTFLYDQGLFTNENQGHQKEQGHS